MAFKEMKKLLFSGFHWSVGHFRLVRLFREANHLWMVQQDTSREAEAEDGV